MSRLAGLRRWPWAVAATLVVAATMAVVWPGPAGSGPAGDAVLVNASSGANATWGPTVAMNRAGTRFAVAWAESNIVRLSIYDLAAGGTSPRVAAGSLPLGVTLRDRPAVAVNASGGVAVAWTGSSDGSAGGASDIHLRVYTAQGAITYDGRVNLFTPGDQDGPALGLDDHGRAVVVWQGPVGFCAGAACSYFDLDGIGARVVPSGAHQDTLVNATTEGVQGHPAVVVAGDAHQAIVAWDGAGGGDADGAFFRAMYYQSFPYAFPRGEGRLSFSPAGAQRRPTLSSDANLGELVAGWEGAGWDDYPARGTAASDNAGVFAGRFTGQPHNYTHTQERRLNTTAPGTQAAASVGLANGNLWGGTWTSNQAGTPDVFARRLRPQRASTEFEPTGGTSGTQTGSVMAMAGDGRYVLAWRGAVSGAGSGGIYVRVFRPDDAPQATADTYTTDEDVAIDQAAPGLLANDRDADGDVLAVRSETIESAAGGTVEIHDDGGFVYTPAENFHGDDTFSYTIDDGTSSATAIASITVTSVEDGPPKATADEFQATEGQDLVVGAPGVLGNDTEPDGEPMTAERARPPTNGQLLEFNEDGSFSYRPNANFGGTDTFTYRARDAASKSGETEVRITVKNLNDSDPVAVPDRYQLTENQPLDVPAPGVLANDTDPDGDRLTAVADVTPESGEVDLRGDGSFRYTPRDGFCGTDSFGYRASDGTHESAATTVELRVSCVDDPPVARDDVYQTDEDRPLSVPAPGVLTNDSDDTPGPLQATLVTGVETGKLALNPDGSFTYSSPQDFVGREAFTYVVSNGEVKSKPAKVTITVGAVGDAPVVNNDAYSTGEDVTLRVRAPGVLGNDSNPDGGPLTAALERPPQHGRVELAADGGFTYDPPRDFNGLDSFSYLAKSAEGSSAASVTIAVGAVADAVIATDDRYRVTAGQPLAVAAPGVLGNDVNPDGGPLAATVDLPPGQGSFEFNPDGSFLYAPPESFTGGDGFRYSVRDEQGNVATATVYLTVVRDDGAGEAGQGFSAPGGRSGADGGGEVVASQAGGGSAGVSPPPAPRRSAPPAGGQIRGASRAPAVASPAPTAPAGPPAPAAPLGSGPSPPPPSTTAPGPPGTGFATAPTASSDDSPHPLALAGVTATAILVAVALLGLLPPGQPASLYRRPRRRR